MLPPRIESKIDRTSDCWIWIAALDRRGYGVVSWKGLAKRAHRVVYEILVGTTELELDHLCRVHACVKPNHLEPVTHAENVRRGNAGRMMTERWAQARNCPQGHPLSGDNLYIHYSQRLHRTNRQCRQCKRDTKRQRRANGAKD